jgi:translation elongation factor EF-Ts
MTPTRNELLRQLRERTGASVLLIREALEACAGDLARAEQYINEHRKGPRPDEPRHGVIVADTHQGRIGVLVEVRCGTDFVARTEEFRALCRELLLQALGGTGEGRLEEQDYVRDPSRKVANLIEECARKVGETIRVERYVRWTVG